MKKLSLEIGKLEVVSDKPIIIENEKNIIPIIIVDTSSDANIDDHMKKVNTYENGILILSDKIIVSSSLLSENRSIDLSDVPAGVVDNKQELLNNLNESNMMYIYVLILETIFMYLFIVYLASNLVDAFVLGVLGYIFARIVRLRLRFRATFNIGIHALTLPIILNLVYIGINTFIGFNISYFQWMYTSISYIYVAVAILMIKAEIINQKIQLIKLQQIQEQATEEEQLEEEPKEKEEKKDKQEDKKTEKKEKQEESLGDGEPEGSNA